MPSPITNSAHARRENIEKSRVVSALMDVRAAIVAPNHIGVGASLA
jgi:hypothetical protein